jgi:hypothetical protein
MVPGPARPYPPHSARTIIAAQMGRSGSTLLALVVLAHSLHACGGNEDDGSGGPVFGESVQLEAVDGQVLIEEPGEETFATLEQVTTVPAGTGIDASEGTVRMTSATEDGGTQSGEFSQGGFEVSQEPESDEVTLTLRGGDFSECKTKAAQRDRSTVGGPEIRKLFVSANGNFRTVGRFAAAAIRGTKFTAIDACFGTLTAVREGDVAVTDLTTDQEIELNAGEDYWAAQRP